MHRLLSVRIPMLVRCKLYIGLCIGVMGRRLLGLRFRFLQLGAAKKFTVIIAPDYTQLC